MMCRSITVLMAVCLSLASPPRITLAYDSQAVSCSCYCGVTLTPPCGDESCMSACGYQEPAYQAPADAGGSGVVMEDAATTARLAEQEAARKAKEDAARLAREEAARAEAERQLRFLRGRDEAARTLKGASGAGELKGTPPETGGLKDAAVAVPEPPKPALGGMTERLKKAIENWKEDFDARKAAPAGAPAAPAGVSDGAVKAYAQNGDAKYPRIDEIERSPGREAWLRGMDAAAKHDWQLALAWFQTAQGKDPGNKALGRAVDLAQWTWDKRRAPSQDSAVAVPRDEDLELLFFERQASWPGSKQIPKDKDVEFLFPQTQPATAVQAPKDEDAALLFPQTNP